MKEGLIGTIVSDLTSDGKALSDILLKVQVLAHSINNSKLRDWTEKELNGYIGHEVPAYRKIPSAVFANLLQEDGFGGARMRQNQRLPAELLDDYWSNALTSMEVRSNVSELEGMRDSGTDFRADVSPGIYGHFQRIMSGWTIDSAWQILTSNQIKGILNSLKSNLLTFLLEINDELEDKEDLTALKGKPSVDKAFEGSIGSISAKTVNVSYGSESVISSSEGDSSPNVVGVGDKVTQNVNVQDIGKVKEFVALLKESIDKLELRDDEKADIAAEVARIDSQIARDKPKFNIINSALVMINQLLTGVAANAYTPLILSKLQELLP